MKIKAYMVNGTATTVTTAMSVEEFEAMLNDDSPYRRFGYQHRSGSTEPFVITIADRHVLSWEYPV